MPRDAAAAEKPASKIRKTDAIEVEMIGALLSSLEHFDEYDTSDFQIEVPKLVKKIRLLKHAVPPDTPFDSQCNTPPVVPNK